MNIFENELLSLGLVIQESRGCGSLLGVFQCPCCRGGAGGILQGVECIGSDGDFSKPFD